MTVQVNNLIAVVVTRSCTWDQLGTYADTHECMCEQRNLNKLYGRTNVSSSDDLPSGLLLYVKLMSTLWCELFCRYALSFLMCNCLGIELLGHWCM